MIRGLYTSSAGMQVEMMRQEAIANNLANVDTNGFKRDLATLMAREKKGLMRVNNHAGGSGAGMSHPRVGIGEIGTGVLLNRVHKRFEQGELRETENPFDLALHGEGFFTLQDAQGNTVYTRAGDFTRDAQGRLADKTGRLLMGEGGPITVPNGRLSVGIDGGVAVDGKAAGRLALVRFENPDDELEKIGDTHFRAGAAGNPLAAAGSVEVHQGMLEGTNVNAVREMVEMIAAMRHYEANQKAVQSQDETLGKAVNEIARQ